MAAVQPITIQRGTFACTLCDISVLMELPLASVRMLWKIMFSAEDENRETIQMIRDWLPVNATECAERISRAWSEWAAWKTTSTFAEKEVRAEKAVYARARKLQTIFNEMSKK